MAETDDTITPSAATQAVLALAGRSAGAFVVLKSVDSRSDGLIPDPHLCCTGFSLVVTVIYVIVLFARAVNGLLTSASSSR